MKTFTLPFIAIGIAGMVGCSTDQNMASIEKTLYVQVTNQMGSLHFEGSEVEEQAHFFDAVEALSEGTLLQTGCAIYTPGGRAQLKVDFMCNRELKGKIAGIYEKGTYRNNQISDCTVVNIEFTDEAGSTWKLAKDSDPNFLFEIMGVEPYNSLVTGEAKQLIECRFDVKMVNQYGEVASHQGQFMSPIPLTAK